MTGLTVMVRQDHTKNVVPTLVLTHYYDLVQEQQDQVGLVQSITPGTSCHSPDAQLPKQINH